ncbi:hypothetical protein [Burkholderia ubonensis]|uniref:hypothetical protein n=1 Tax=Burkholderia ubonensis TaxID=101571 RepID=UPI000B306AD2|nr:hypothetical protein [Burkholderia ubonensis]
MAINSIFKLVAMTALFATSSIGVRAEYLVKDNSGGNVSRLAQSFNEQVASTIRTVKANQLVDAFDSAKNDKGEIRLLDSSGKSDITIIIGNRSGVRVEVDDGRSTASLNTYDGTVDGHRAMMVRSKDRLNISWIDGKSERRVFREFVKGGTEEIRKSEPLIKSQVANGVASRPKRSLSNLEQLTASVEAENYPNSPIWLYVFVHDDMNNPSVTSIHATHFAWWVEHMQRDVAPGLEISISYLYNKPGVTNMAYRNTGGSVLDVYLAFASNVRNYFGVAGRQLYFNDQHKHKALLLTKHPLTSEVYGYAVIGNEYAIASSDPSITPAHELGHLFRAVHSDGEVRYRNGWWCETLMYSADLWSDFRSVCPEYSEKNKQRIRNYLRE